MRSTDGRARCDQAPLPAGPGRQIIAIAKVAGATTIYSDDGDIMRFAKGAGIAVVRIQDLPLPPQDTQMPLPLLETENEPEERAGEDQADPKSAPEAQRQPD